MINSNMEVTIIRNPMEVYVESASKEIEQLLKDNFTVDYIGDLQWVIKPKIKNIRITGTFNYEDTI